MKRLCSYVFWKNCNKIRSSNLSQNKGEEKPEREDSLDTVGPTSPRGEVVIDS
jgi:hypothetical protein